MGIEFAPVPPGASPLPCWITWGTEEIHTTTAPTETPTHSLSSWSSSPDHPAHPHGFTHSLSPCLSRSPTHTFFSFIFAVYKPRFCFKLSSINTLKPLCHKTEWNACQMIASLTSLDRRLPFSIPAGENQKQIEKEREKKKVVWYSLSLFNLSPYPST